MYTPRTSCLKIKYSVIAIKNMCFVFRKHLAKLNKLIFYTNIVQCP